MLASVSEHLSHLRLTGFGDNLLKISRELFIDAIPTREFGQFKVDSCLLMRPKSNVEKERCDRGGGVHDTFYGIQHAWKAEYIIMVGNLYFSCPKLFNTFSHILT